MKNTKNTNKGLYEKIDKFIGEMTNEFVFTAQKNMAEAKLICRNLFTNEKKFRLVRKALNKAALVRKQEEDDLLREKQLEWHQENVVEGKFALEA